MDVHLTARARRRFVLRVTLGACALLLAVSAAHAEDLFGVGLAGPGDLDGDGRPDLVASDPWDAGLRGRGPGRVYALSGADGEPLWERRGRHDGERFGTHLLAAGDLDGDGVGDVLVGVAGVVADAAGAGSATGFDGGGPGAGDEVAASQGERSHGPGAVVALGGADGQPLWRVTVDHGGHIMPWWTAVASPALASLDDVDGDGRRDVLVGLALADGAARQPEAGRVLLLSGASGAVLAERRGERAGQRFGVAVLGVGDADGDGLADVVASSVPRAPEADPGAPAVLTLLSGADLSERARRASPDRRLGLLLAEVGDHDGDGVDDLLASRPFSTGGEALVVLSGRDLATLAALRSRGGPSFGASLGRRGAWLPAARGVLVAAPRSFVPDGGPGAWWFPLVEGARVLPLVGCNNDPTCETLGDSHFGAALAELGDLDGDGAAELLVGSASIRGKAAFSGAVRVFDGSTGASLWHRHLHDL